MPVRPYRPYPDHPGHQQSLTQDQTPSVHPSGPHARSDPAPFDEGSTWGRTQQEPGARRGEVWCPLGTLGIYREGNWNTHWKLVKICQALAVLHLFAVPGCSWTSARSLQHRFCPWCGCRVPWRGMAQVSAEPTWGSAAPGSHPAGPSPQILISPASSAARPQGLGQCHLQPAGPEAAPCLVAGAEVVPSTCALKPVWFQKALER